MPLPPAGLRVDDWLLRVSRAEIEARDIIPAILELGPLLAPENVTRFKRKLTLWVDGYDDDPRELFEIDEVRRWVQLLDVAFPFWFYFLSLEPRSSLRWIPLCLCPYGSRGKTIDPGALDRFLKWHLFAMGSLCAVHRIPGEELDRLAKEIHEFFGK
jgi:hypothetical protein